MAELEIRAERCKGCSLCVQACKKNLLVLGENHNAMGYATVQLLDAVSCTACALCAQMCPDLVIEVWK